MIVVDHQSHLVTVNVFGEFTVADYREFEDLVNYKIKFEGPVNLLFDLRQMTSLTIDMAWEEVKFTRAHASDFDRIAVLTDSQWVKWSAWLTQAFVRADLRLFEDEIEAREWVAESED